MNKKRKFSNSATWWMDYSIINRGINFSYSKYNNIFFLKINNNTNFLFFLINKYNLNSLFFYIVDSLVVKNIYYITYQSFFYDFKILVKSRFKRNIKSLSRIYGNMIWSERENKEFNKVFFLNLKDSRKLLSNYNYNNHNNYNNYSTIINDIYA
jgi:hypothetical protein